MKIEELRQGILQQCFVREDTLFSWGVSANNKLDVERLDNNSDLTTEVVRRIGRVVLEDAPDFVVGVPNGANWLAERVADRTRLNLVVLKSDLDKNITYADIRRSEYTAIKGHRGVLVEDVFNKFTSTRRVLDLEPLGAKIGSVVSVWDRGNTHERTELEIPHTSLITQFIPEQLASDSELWKYSA